MPLARAGNPERRHVTYYKSVLAAKLAASPALDVGNEIYAIAT